MLDRTTPLFAVPTERTRHDALSAFFVAPADVAALAPAIAALAARSATLNPHASAAGLAASAARHERAIAVAVRDGSGALNGLWPLAIRRAPPGLAVLRAPAEPLYDLTGVPLLAIGKERAALACLLDALRQAPRTPKALLLRAVPTGSPFWEALTEEALAGRIDLVELVRWERAICERRHWTSAADYMRAAHSGARLKRWRQKRRGLEALGAVHEQHATSPAVIDRAFAAFLALEASGWKGRAGSALQQRTRDAAYVRDVLLRHAETGDAFIHALTIDGRMVASGLFVAQQGAVWFWKTAFDETLARHSPGVLLDLAVTEWLFADGRFAELDTGTDDSVSPADLIWTERRTFANAVVSLETGSLSTQVSILAQQARHTIRAWRLARAKAGRVG
jgi:CelD/BcsL family acetyltransferase involved in cellulose biosynthesis